MSKLRYALLSIKTSANYGMNGGYYFGGMVLLFGGYGSG